MLKRGFVGRGMDLEFSHPAYRAPIITSRIKEIRECHKTSQRDTVAPPDCCVRVTLRQQQDSNKRTDHPTPQPQRKAPGKTDPRSKGGGGGGGGRAGRPIWPRESFRLNFSGYFWVCGFNGFGGFAGWLTLI